MTRSRSDASLPPVIVLDFDGVVLESVQAKTDAFAKLFAAERQHLPDILALHERQGGISRFEKFRTIYRDILCRPLPPDEAETLARHFQDLVLENVLSCPFVPGALEFLRAARGTCRLYVASGTPQDELRHIVERRGLSEFFSGVFGSPAVKEDILTAVLGREGITADLAAMVGDAATDFIAAQAVGMPFVGRVPPGECNPFPAGIPVVPDLAGLAAVLAERAGQAGAVGLMVDGRQACGQRGDTAKQ